MTAATTQSGGDAEPSRVDPIVALRTLLDEHGLSVRDAPDDSTADLFLSVSPDTEIDDSFPFAHTEEKGITTKIKRIEADGDGQSVNVGLTAEANTNGPFEFAEFYFGAYIDVTYQIDGADWTDDPPEQAALVAAAQNHGRTALARHAAALSPDEYSRFTNRAAAIAGGE